MGVRRHILTDLPLLEPCRQFLVSFPFLPTAQLLAGIGGAPEIETLASQSVFTVEYCQIPLAIATPFLDRPPFNSSIIPTPKGPLPAARL